MSPARGRSALPAASPRPAVDDLVCLARVLREPGEDATTMSGLNVLSSGSSSCADAVAGEPRVGVRAVVAERLAECREVFEHVGPGDGEEGADRCRSWPAAIPRNP